MDDAPQSMSPRRIKRRQMFALILIGLGLIFLLDNLMPEFDLGRYWPLILVVLGLALLMKDRR